MRFMLLVALAVFSAGDVSLSMPAAPHTPTLSAPLEADEPQVACRLLRGLRRVFCRRC